MSFIDSYRRRAERHMDEMAAAPMVSRTSTPGGWKLRDHPLAIAAAGLVLIVAAAVGYWLPGVIFKGSVSQVRGLCDSSILLAAQPSCAQAAHWTSGLALAGVAGIILAAAGGFLAAGQRQH